MWVTADDIKELIQAAQAAGLNAADIEDLQEHLEEIESGKLFDRGEGQFVSEKIDSIGRKVISVSTAPISPDDDDDFEGVEFKSLDRSSPRS